MEKLIDNNEVEQIYAPDGAPMSVAVLLSGSGTNFIAIYEEAERLRKAGESVYGRVDAVFTNAPKCKGAEKAREYGIPVISLSSNRYFGTLDKGPEDEEVREYYDAAVITLIEQVCAPDLIVLAGYRRRLGGGFINRYKNKIINLYPGDITKDYLVRGIDASVQALRAGEKDIKCTVYLEKQGERFGPALVQSEPIALKGFKERNIESLNLKIREDGEWKIFPYAVHELIAKGRAVADGDGNIYVDGEKLDPSGFQYPS